MKKYMLDTNAMEAIVEQNVLFDDFSDICITNWAEKEFLEYYQNSAKFASYDSQKQDESLDSRKNFLENIPTENIIRPNHEWCVEIRDALNVSGSNIAKKTNVNDAILVALSKRPEGKEYVFVFFGEKKCRRDVQEGGCTVIDFAEFKNQKSYRFTLNHL